VQLLLLLLTPPADRVGEGWRVGKGVEVGRTKRGDTQRGGVAGTKQGREGTGLQRLSAYVRFRLPAASRVGLHYLLGRLVSWLQSCMSSTEPTPTLHKIRQIGPIHKHSTAARVSCTQLLRPWLQRLY